MKRKVTVAKKAVVNISSDSEPIDDKTSRPNASHSRASTNADPVAVVAGPSSTANRTKTSTTKNKKASAPLTATITPSTSQSSAKTTVKRRVKSTTTVLVAASSATRPVVRKKRKFNLDDSSDEEVFKPDPDAMKAGLARAPVPRIPASSTTGQKTGHSKDALSSPSGKSTSSKRRRITGTTPRHPIGHTSGEEGDVEEVPSSISGELGLVLPKKKTKVGLKAKEVNASVDKWRRETSVLVVNNEPTPPLTDSPLTSPSERSPTPELLPLDNDQPVEEDPMMDVDMTEAADLLQGTQPHQGSDVEVSQQLVAEDSSSLSSLTSVLSDLEPPTPSPPALLEPEAWVTRPTTPPLPDELPPMPPTPVALDVATKTAQTIARIRAAAQAAAREQLDASEDQIELAELSDSDLESLDFNAQLAR